MTDFTIDFDLPTFLVSAMIGLLLVFDSFRTTVFGFGTVVVSVFIEQSFNGSPTVWYCDSSGMGMSQVF